MWLSVQSIQPRPAERITNEVRVLTSRGTFEQAFNLCPDGDYIVGLHRELGVLSISQKRGGEDVLILPKLSQKEMAQMLDMPVPYALSILFERIADRQTR